MIKDRNIVFDKKVKASCYLGLSSCFACLCKHKNPIWSTDGWLTGVVPKGYLINSPKIHEVVSSWESVSSSPWYIGVGTGISFGRGTFCSFAANSTYPGCNIGIISGYDINSLLSAEISFNYTRLRLSAYDCCTELWLGNDGNRYFAPVAGMINYPYRDLYSVSNLVSIGTHLNVDLISIWKAHSQWSFLITPAIYLLYSNATVKKGSAAINGQSGMHFGMGTDLGMRYMITSQWGLQLCMGIKYITGKSIDALPKEEHRTNYVWDTGIRVLFKLKR